jgi:hypothetical protein
MGFAWSVNANDFGMSQLWERATFSPRHRKPPRWSRRFRAVAGLARRASGVPGALRRTSRAAG